MEESNSKFRNWNLTNYNHEDILGMIHGTVKNNLYIGDYLIIDKIAYRFARFYDNKCAVLIPDRIISRSKNNFGKVISKSYEESYVHKTVLPRLLHDFSINQFPVIDARLISENDLITLPLFAYNKSFIREHFGKPYLLSDINNKYSYKCVDSDGKISTTASDSYIGIRPMIYIGYSIFKI